MKLNFDKKNSNSNTQINVKVGQNGLFQNENI